MKTQAVHLTMHECGLMCNLLVVAMEANKKTFEEQAPEVKMLSTKLANSFKVHERKLRESQQKKTKTVFDK